MKSWCILLLSVAVSLVQGAWAQTAGAAGQRAQVAGTIASVDAAAKKLSIKTDKGDTVNVETTDRSFFRRMPPGETDTKKAVAIALSDIATGDRVVAIGQPTADQKGFEARTIYIMTKSDVAQVHEKEMEDWKARGTVGNVASIDAGAKTFTIKAGARTVTVQPSDKTEFLRYALDSAKISDAKPGAFDQIKVGDQAHVLGNKNADGTTVTAEKVVFGSFKQIAATVATIDAQAGTLTVKDLAAKKGAPPVVLKITADTTLKKLSPEMATMLARRYAPGAQQGDAARGGAASGRGAPTQGGPGGPGGRGPGMGGGRGGMDIQRMLENVPATSLADLKPGDAVMVSTTEGSDATHLTAIMLLAGVDDVLRAAPNSTRDIMSGWNLGGGGGGDQ